MDLKQCAKWLLDNQYAVVVNNSFILTRQFFDELKLLDSQATNKAAEVVKPFIPGVKVLDDKKDLWNQFCLDAEIPHRVQAPTGGSYTVRQYSLANANRLIKIINDPSIEYKVLVDSTKNYYRTVTYKTMLSNYFEKEIWRGEYDAWKAGKTRAMDGSSMLED